MKTVCSLLVTVKDSPGFSILSAFASGRLWITFWGARFGHTAARFDHTQMHALGMPEYILNPHQISQIPPDLVVKFQPIDIVDITL
jgi:hypothetical protein